MRYLWRVFLAPGQNRYCAGKLEAVVDMTRTNHLAVFDIATNLRRLNIGAWAWGLAPKFFRFDRSSKLPASTLQPPFSFTSTESKHPPATLQLPAPSLAPPMEPPGELPSPPVSNASKYTVDVFERVVRADFSRDERCVKVAGHSVFS